ncbi:glycoside hydrolase family 3 protein [Lactiplantibacillus plantarum]|uniref:glycoside hydrolase family 3 protein n=1 Tax=Lactiplantibacillus plantarum TaxID=1590 RepID=UPI001363CC83|nr:glycoside hydrolase family 3 N-terminal domain-containing protein [Lactiplantibacillus plantarum]MDR7678629.1 glycoside hydrolase family 3 N-terminal domain-containing protein [Lactiplantibacillus plantarum]QHM45022.1 Beta-glucosidase BoGH3B [Lactiplantibacillus plantarum]
MALIKVDNGKGKTLVYSSTSGLNLIEQDGLKFKDNDHTGVLKPFEDWRLTPLDRAKDLAKRLSIKDIAGLMLFTSHLAVPAVGDRKSLYNGKMYEESGADADELTDLEKEYFLKKGIKHSLVTTVESPAIGAKWNNRVQALSESMPWALPVVNSTDPRHGYNADTEFNEGSGGGSSQWPESIGLAATFDPEVLRQFGDVASKEDRAMGISMYLGPQVDMATEPRWMRLNGTLGENSRMSAEMASALISGLQVTPDRDDWGDESISTITKHWPGGGVIEGGRDAHFGYGKFGVYPGGNQGYQLKPFEAAIDSNKREVDRTAGIMPYYSISTDFAPGNSENVGNAYNYYLIHDLLRGHYDYDEVVCTDWCITEDEPTNVLDVLSGDQCWGVEDNYTVGERHLKLLMAGVDQFGGDKNPQPILWAYEEMSKLMSPAWAEQRFRLSARRILKRMFQLGLFENPYTDPEVATQTVGRKDFVQAGLIAQEKSVIMLKNRDHILPLNKGVKVYIPSRRYPATHGWYGDPIAEMNKVPFNLDILSERVNVVDNPDDADVALVKIKSPERDLTKDNGYDPTRVSENDNGYLPVTLQYRPYTAKTARAVSLAGDGRKGQVKNRTYKDKTTTTLNESDLDLVIETKAKMGNRPVIVSVTATNPFVVSEFEPYADAILLDFGVSDQATLAIIDGEFEPSGLLPVQFPRDMETVEAQQEDTPFDMVPYQDAEGNVYDFGFGLNYEGQIQDWRTTRYNKDALNA